MLRGIRKKFMMVLRASSGIYWDLIFIIDGQKMPTHASNVQKPSSWIEPPTDVPPPFSVDGATKICSRKANSSSMLFSFLFKTVVVTVLNHSFFLKI
jgi:hypothetical protein